MRKAKLVICDIDSTLVVRHQSLTPRAKRVIDTLRERGVWFGLASGRPLFQIRPFLTDWGYEDMDVIVALNGSSVWDGLEKKEYTYDQMKKEWIRQALELMRPFPCSPSVYHKDSQLFLYDDDVMEMAKTFSNTSNYGTTVALADDESDLYAEDGGKIMFRLDEAIMPEVEAWLAAHPSDDFAAFKTQPNLMEFCNKNASKATGTRDFCTRHNITMADVAAFGDTTNDNDMIVAAGWGVCMQNGSDDTKAVADDITELSCDEDGWAAYMEKYFL